MSYRHIVPPQEDKPAFGRKIQDLQLSIQTETIPSVLSARAERSGLSARSARNTFLHKLSTVEFRDCNIFRRPDHTLFFTVERQVLLDKITRTVGSHMKSHTDWSGPEIEVDFDLVPGLTYVDGCKGAIQAIGEIMPVFSEPSGVFTKSAHDPTEIVPRLDWQDVPYAKTKFLVAGFVIGVALLKKFHMNLSFPEAMISAMLGRSADDMGVAPQLSLVRRGLEQVFPMTLIDKFSSSEIVFLLSGKVSSAEYATTTTSTYVPTSSGLVRPSTGSRPPSAPLVGVGGPRAYIMPETPFVRNSFKL